MSKDDIYNQLCQIFYLEEIRLENNLTNIRNYCNIYGGDKYSFVSYIEAQTKLDYFRSYMLDVLKYLSNFNT